MIHTLHGTPSLTDNKPQQYQSTGHDSSDSKRRCQSGYCVTGSADDQRLLVGRRGPLRPNYPNSTKGAIGSKSHCLCYRIDSALFPDLGKATSRRLTGHITRQKPPERECVIWDTEVPGFGIRLYPSGQKRWVARYIERRRPGRKPSAMSPRWTSTKLGGLHGLNWKEQRSMGFHKSQRHQP